jgi:hypothetical protein
VFSFSQPVIDVSIEMGPKEENGRKMEILYPIRHHAPDLNSEPNGG